MAVDGARGGAVAGSRELAGAGAEAESRVLVSGRASLEGVAGSQVAEIQRSRLVAAAIRAVEELGYGDVTVAQITARARVSRRTFYELFANREECLAAVLDDVVGLVGGELAAAGLDGLEWRERVRTGLWVILSCFDREPVLAKVCVIQALRGGPEVLQRRGEILGALAAVVDEGRGESSRGKELTPLVAEGLVGAAFGILHARLLRERAPVLRGLLGELMGLIVLPYLGPTVARREHTRPAPGPLVGARKFVRVQRGAGDPLDGVPIRLTYRTARVLEGVGGHPGASNREVAQLAGIQDQGQVSKLLARLERVGLLANQGSGHPKGEPNAWALTIKGQHVAKELHVYRPRPDRKQAA
jgi:AcrR family transcriptional regulator